MNRVGSSPVRTRRKVVATRISISLKRSRLQILLPIAIEAFGFEVVLKGFRDRKTFQVDYLKVRGFVGVYAVEKQGSSNRLLTINGISFVASTRIYLLVALTDAFSVDVGVSITSDRTKEGSSGPFRTMPGSIEPRTPVTGVVS